jgi:uncharacterized RDD family membrane protein YckC
MPTTSSFSETAPAGTSPDVHVVMRRLLAFVIDAFLLVFVTRVVGRLLTPFHVTVAPLSPSSAAVLDLMFRKPAAPLWPVVAPLVIIYFTLLEVLFGLTVGKALAGLRVVNRQGGPPRFEAVVLRNLLRPLEAWSATAWLGGLVILWSAHRQRIGDHLAGTLVADARSVPAASLTRRSARRRALACALAVPSAYLACLVIAYTAASPVVIDRAWNERTGAVSSSGLAVGLPGHVTQIIMWGLTGPRRAGGLLSYGVWYKVLTRRPERSHICHATVRLRWADGLWSGGWAPHDWDNECLGATHHGPF